MPFPSRLVAPLLLAMLVTGGCGPRDQPQGSTSTNTSPNASILEEINQARAWFHAKRVRPIWAKQVDKDQMVKTIEGTEQVKAGDFLCRGEAGEVWPQSAARLEAKYQKTDEVDADCWRKYVPRADNQGVMAAQVQHTFRVQGKGGLLSGKAGDYIVKDFADRNVAFPEDVWIVDQKLFHATYQAVGNEPEA
jgi:hypothetical protein